MNVTYYAISPTELEAILSDAATPDRMLKDSTVLKQFDMCRSRLQSLVKQGRIKRYAIPGDRKSIRYSEKEIRAIWKQL